MKFSKRIVLIIVLCASASLRLNAQVRPVNDYGALGLGHLLNRLQTTASVMMIGAHPDDEDSALLAYLARGENARTAYLSLTRGDGGQNIIGPELFEPLGIIRTEELLQARRLDGAEQYFTRAYDYGFSKTLAEAKSKWPEEVIKCDVVRAIRLFRPMVVISRFTGTPADGHGQHQYAGYITPIAVKAAADPKQCSDAGEPWQMLKFYVEQSFSDKTKPTLKINTGQFDPLLGRTYFEIAMEGRSMHRSQGEGRLELHGDQFSGLNLVDHRADKENSIFQGINTTLAGADDPLGQSGRPTFGDVALVGEMAEKARSNYRPTASGNETLTALSGLYSSLRSAVASPHRTSGSAFLMRKKLEECATAIRIASGLQIDALADSDTVVPGGDISISLKIYVPKDSPMTIRAAGLATPPRWNSVRSDSPKESTAGFIRREIATLSDSYKVTVPLDERLTQPYWLAYPREADVFRRELSVDWPGEKTTLPFQPAGLKAFVTVEVAGTRVDFQQPIQFRFADPARGEIRRELNVVPPLSVSIDQSLIVVPSSDRAQTKTINVVVNKTTCKSMATTGRVQMGAYGEDWKFVYPKQEYSLTTCGEKLAVPITVTIPPRVRPRDYTFWARVVGSDVSYDQSMNIVAYPHIQSHRFYRRAEATVEVLDLKTAPVKVGYIMGSGDEVPEAIRQMGLDVTMLEEKDLASGDLSKFDTVVVGIRASETRPDLVANNARLLDYVKNGGTVIMQYQRGNWTGLAPFPVDTQDKQGTAAGNINRVVDENAAVKILDPQHPVLNFPNRITDADFNGWVQERNAYNLVTFDPQYTPLLESHDAGEQENKGGLVIAKLGKGNWVYCSYSFFRQLPAGVPGAYRLFANLLSLPKSQNRER